MGKGEVWFGGGYGMVICFGCCGFSFCFDIFYGLWFLVVSMISIA